MERRIGGAGMGEQTPQRRHIAGLTGQFDSLDAYMEFNKKGRQERTPRGEKHANTRLTEAQVKEIRRSYAAGEKDGPTLSKEYGVSSASIDNIVNGTTWGHVDGISQEKLAAIRKARKIESQAKATDATRKLSEDDVRAIRAEYVKGIGKKLSRAASGRAGGAEVDRNLEQVRRFFLRDTVGVFPESHHFVGDSQLSQSLVEQHETELGFVHLVIHGR